MVTVAQAMTANIVTVTLDHTLKTIASLFDRHGFHHLIVVDGGAVVGVISDRDLLRNVSPFVGTFGESLADMKTLDRRAHQIMTRIIISAQPDEPLADAAQRMLDQRVSCLPVIGDQGACVGILTLRDVAKWSISHCLIDPGDSAEQSRAA